jgi:hypothetical protein
VWSSTATSWNGQTQFWSYVNQPQVTAMVNDGVTTLTNTNTVADAWRAIIPGYTTGQKIAIKVNFNNMPDSAGCGATVSDIDSVIEPINAIIAGLISMGVAENDIWVYDAMRRIPDRFVTPCPYPNVQFFDKFGGCSRRQVAGWGNYTVTFSSGISSVQHIAVPLLNAAYLINVPIMKPHFCNGVTLGFKHHYGTIDSPGDLHRYSFVSCDGTQYSADRNPLVDIMRDPNVGPKTVLTIGDGLLCCREGENRPPTAWASFDYRPPNSMFFSRDLVAIDCVMHDFIRYEHNIEGITFYPQSGRYLELAANAGLGTCEHVANPHSDSYSTIQYIRHNI